MAQAANQLGGLRNGYNDGGALSNANLGMGATLSVTNRQTGNLNNAQSNKKFYHLAEAQTEFNKTVEDRTVYMRKSRTNFGGGFKVPEEYKAKRQHGKRPTQEEQDSDEDDKNPTFVTKKAVLEKIGLGDSQTLTGADGGSHAQLTKDTCEGLEKDMKKLKMLEENIKNRRIREMPGGEEFLAQTDETRQQKRIENLKNQVKSQDAGVIHVDEKRLQLLRHQPGQLESLKKLEFPCKYDIEAQGGKQTLDQRPFPLIREENKGKPVWDLDELEAVRQQTRMRVQQLESVLFKDPDGNWLNPDQPVTKELRKKELRDKNEAEEAAKKKREMMLGMPIEDEDSREIVKSVNKVQVVEEMSDDDVCVRHANNDEKPSWQMSYPFPLPGGQKSKYAYQKEDEVTPREHEMKPLKKRSWSQLSTRERAYQTKYQNSSKIYQAIRQKEKATRWDRKQDFDRFTKSSKSPSVRTMFYKENRDAKSLSPTKFGELMKSGYFESLIPKGYEEALMQQELVCPDWPDPFKLLGVSKEDKMTFFLLKWIFNACKQNLDGETVMLKSELLEQLEQNDKILRAMNTTGVPSYEFLEDLDHRLGQGETVSWDQFCQAFFYDPTLQPQQRQGTPNWWLKVDLEGREKPSPSKLVSPTKNADLKEHMPQVNQKTLVSFKQIIPEVKMTPQLELLLNERRARTEAELELEFAKNQRLIMSGQSPVKRGKAAPSAAVIDSPPIKDDEERSQLLLQPSQIEIMHQVFQEVDKRNDEVLKRSDFALKLRTSNKVVPFLNADAVKTCEVKPRILTLDQIIIEVEKDEMGEKLHSATKMQENYREFISWREFMTYLEDYKDFDERMQKNQRIQKLKQSVTQKSVQIAEETPEHQLQEELERRVAELPKLRRADEISLSHEHLLMVKAMFDSEKTGKLCNSSFFVAVRKSPEFQNLRTVLARDPEGESRLPKETMQQVFDRMEKDLYGRDFAFSTVIEYFTRRGVPLSQDEIRQLQQEDRQVREEEAAMKREQEEKGRSPADFKTLADSGTGEEEDPEQFAHAGQEGGSRTIKYTSSAKVVSRRPLSSRERKFSKVTVPIPMEMELREKTRKQTISQRKFETYIAAIKAEDEVQFTFRCKPVPSSVLQPRFNKIQEANLRRRQSVKAESIKLTKERERPFEFWLRDWPQLAKKQKRARSEWDNEVVLDSEDEETQGVNPELLRSSFTANPIPKACSVLVYHENLKKQEQARRKRISENAEKLRAKSSMPSRMQKDADQKKDKPAKKDNFREDCTFQPKIGRPMTKEKFERKQKAFAEKLNRRKEQITTTRCQEFNFSKTKIKYLERDYNDEAKTHADRERNERQLNQTQSFKKILQPKEPEKQPASTRSTALLQERRRSEMLQKKEQQKAKEIQDKKRAEGGPVQREFKRQYLTALGCDAPKPAKNPAKTEFDIKPHPDFHAAKANSIERKKQLEQAIQDQKKAEKNVKEQLEKAVEKGWNRECLIDQNLYKEQADKELNIQIGKVMRLINVLLKSGLSLAEAETHLGKDQYTKNRERLVRELVDQGLSQAAALSRIENDPAKAAMIRRPEFRTDRELRMLAIPEKEWDKHRGCQLDEWSLYQMGVSRKLLELPEKKKAAK